MSLKSKTITIEGGRDNGKKFIIHEMPAAKVDEWAMRALMALAGAGVEVPEANEGMMGLAKVAFSALGNVPYEKARPLLNELIDCVEYVPSGGTPRPIDLNIGDIEDFTNIWKLRKEVFNLHIDFLQQGSSPN